MIVNFITRVFQVPNFQWRQRVQSWFNNLTDWEWFKLAVSRKIQGTLEICGKCLLAATTKNFNGLASNHS